MDTARGSTGTATLANRGPAVVWHFRREALGEQGNNAEGLTGTIQDTLIKRNVCILVLVCCMPVVPEVLEIGAESC